MTPITVQSSQTDEGVKFQVTSTEEMATVAMGPAELPACL